MDSIDPIGAALVLQRRVATATGDLLLQQVGEVTGVDDEPQAAQLSVGIQHRVELSVSSACVGNANEPKGIYTTPGVGSKTFSAALPTHAELTDMLHTVLDANAELSSLCFILHTSDFSNLLKQQVTSGGGTTTLQYESGTYRINGIQVLTTSSSTEGKVALLDMSKVNLIYIAAHTSWQIASAAPTR